VPGHQPERKEKEIAEQDNQQKTVNRRLSGTGYLGLFSSLGERCYCRYFDFVVGD
jgi:hypothetical protein